ncbi:MAG: hypothetical protein M1834_004305 [Cirrosporium novae-zelandiae]|nr:MAG: hypothetical protein M1834_004305 [Cirrosporium novae-zelandiae]
MSPNTKDNLTQDPPTAAQTEASEKIAQNRNSQSINPSQHHINAQTKKSAKSFELDKSIQFILNFILAVLGVAAAVVFGIWAPLSYKATADGNRGNDEAQQALLDAVASVNDVASSAASVQSSRLNDLQGRLQAIGELAMVDFCVTQTTLAACDSLLSNYPITSLVSYLGPSTVLFSSQSSTGIGPTASVQPTFVSTSPRASHISVPGILGIIFGAFIFVGMCLGFYIVQRRKRHMFKEQELLATESH